MESDGEPIELEGSNLSRAGTVYVEVWKGSQVSIRFDYDKAGARLQLLVTAEVAEAIARELVACAKEILR